MSDIEKITHVAIRSGGAIGTLPLPCRHADLILAGERESGQQGFMTNRDRFVTREEAYVIAQAAHQIRGILSSCPGTLYSEDICPLKEEQSDE